MASASPSDNPYPATNNPNPNPSPPTTRKFPAPCWTQDETLALINVYQDKWYSLRRRNLRTADWEAVADEVNRRCPNQDTPKSSAQCRHKMEKLRKRYRAEKQRIGSLPPHISYNNRFFPPSSWVFFDLMDTMEIGPVSRSGSVSGVVPVSINGNNSNDVNLLKDGDKLSMIQNGDFVEEEKQEKNDLGKYFDEILMGMGKRVGSSSGSSSMKLKLKNPNHNHNDRYIDENDEGYNNDYNKSGRNIVSGLMKRKFDNGGGGRYGKDWSSSKMKGVDAVVEEMAASIKLLAEGMVRMETMKLEMMQDIERKRMEMEMKKNEMMLESQHNIINAFIQGLKKHNKKVKVNQQQ
ncbi:trihelix transcription factor ASIL1-like [Amaranthus tricolor]|uniref:trihelix transcription factor ASIL1-like n=1 Tax=Amaranthus tricolor TaxID=29722 RepID=UPI002582AA6A|nr:trihelix transcription factor ASIL1-like [Amaranthus tricolor]